MLAPKRGGFHKLRLQNASRTVMPLGGEMGREPSSLFFLFSPSPTQSQSRSLGGREAAHAETRGAWHGKPPGRLATRGLRRACPGYLESARGRGCRGGGAPTGGAPTGGATPCRAPRGSPREPAANSVRHTPAGTRACQCLRVRCVPQPCRTAHRSAKQPETEPPHHPHPPGPQSTKGYSSLSVPSLDCRELQYCCLKCVASL